MEDKALARPLLLTKGVNFTKLVVDRVSALDQRAYNMLFIGTGTTAARSKSSFAPPRAASAVLPASAGIC